MENKKSSIVKIVLSNIGFKKDEMGLIFIYGLLNCKFIFDSECLKVIIEITHKKYRNGLRIGLLKNMWQILYVQY